MEWAAQGPGGEPESSDSMRAFGAVVRALREHAGVSREEFGALVHLSRHSVASIELGRRLADQRFVELAEEATGARGRCGGRSSTWPDSRGCIEVALEWHRPTYSGIQGDDCTEVAPTPTTIHIRDSKDTTRPHLGLGPAAWAAFVVHAAAQAD